MAITNASQLNLFSIISNIVKNDSVLGAKFNDSNIYQFEDTKPKGVNFKGFPYMIISIPSYDIPDRLTVTNKTIIKDFDVTILIVIEWVARSNMVTYCNAILGAIEAHFSNFSDAGYNLPTIELTTPPAPEIVSQKEVVSATFSLKVKGLVNIP